MRLRHLWAGLSVGIAAMLLVSFAPAPARAAADPAAVESAFVAKINALRASKGLGQLQVDAELTTIGRAWAAKMAAVGNISHNPQFQNQVQADWVKLGENVGMGPELDKLHRAFVASPTHYKNLVDGDYTRIGVGVVVTSTGMIFTSHQFERLAADNVVTASAAAPPAAAPAAAPAPKAPAKVAKATAPAAPVPPPVAAPAPVPASPPAPAHAVQVLEQLRHFDRPAA